MCVRHLAQVVGRRELLADARFRAPEGCMCVCPSCEVNTYVKPDGVNAEEPSRLRFAWGEGCCYLGIFSQYVCFNPSCPAVIKKHERNPAALEELRTKVEGGGVFLRRGGPSPPDKLGVAFSANDERLMEELYPMGLRARYTVTFFPGQVGGADVQLAAKLFRSKEDMSEMSESLMAPRRAQEGSCVQRYVCFASAEMAAAAAPPTAIAAWAGAAARGESATAAAAAWPAYRFHHPTDSILHTTAANLTTAIKKLHAKLSPYLLGDLLRRDPGEFASSDGTFRLAIRTLSDGNVILFVMGERGDVIAWYVLLSESWEEMYAALLRLRKRLKRLGKLDKLKYWCDDRCCNGCAADKIAEHVLVYLFPGISRCPYKDGFHAVQTCTKTLHDGTPEGKSEYATEIGSIIRAVHEPDVEAAAAHVVAKKKLGPVAALAEARKTYRHDGIIRTFGPTPSALVNAEGTGAWQRCIEKWRERKRKAIAEGARICIRSQTHELTGTIEQMETLAECLGKGCCACPLPVPQMYFDIKRQPETGLMERKHKNNTGRNEKLHGGGNQIVEHVARMREDLMEVRIEFYIFTHNESIDVTFGLRDSHAMGFTWTMAVLNAAAAGVLEALPFPALSESHESPFKLAPLVPIDATHEDYEPMGFKYLKHEKNAADRAIVERVIAERSGAGLDAGAAFTTAGADDAGPSSPTPAASPASPPGGSGRQGGRRWSAARKARVLTAADLPAITPSSPLEQERMLYAYREARQQHRGATTAAMYATAADLYLTEVTRAHLPPGDPPAQLRPNPTSGAAIKRVLEASLKRSRAIQRERGEDGEASNGEIDDDAVAAAVADGDAREVAAFDGDGDGDAAAMEMAPFDGVGDAVMDEAPMGWDGTAVAVQSTAADTEAAERKRQKREKKAKSNAALIDQACAIVKMRLLTLAECEAMPRSSELTQAVMRAYSKAAGLSTYGSADDMRARFARVMRESSVASPFRDASE